ncbi:hypothetical protein GCM10010168_39340 [Actinoplanes ianthinogenes]|uniref:carboxypeptidase-like regulatory domain-containing protein n=1 Tax=Actinoplanes ianthinogenes TaxID=122358 RepID=UPI00167188A5|nr:carboxypeptidase-like regulatory domain-containing protein [Actinoplanes ianthinogenes]GGR17824.1 hypothetical protein GCM10010168_39340 [Actinoplanes ianthinogenes]
MTTHLRDRAVQAGAFLALVVGLVAGVQTAALAASPTVDLPGSLSGDSGATVTVQYTVGNPGDSNGGNENQGKALVIVTSNASGCNDCGISNDQLAPGETASHTVHITLPTVDAGQTKSVSLQVSAAIAGSDPTSKSVSITVKGPEAPQTVRQVSGKVRAVDGTRLPGATVAMKDSQGHTYQATSDADGQFAFTSSDAQPISPGSITVGASLGGYKVAQTTVNGKANKSVTATITLKPAASASASASASPSASTSATPADEATEDEVPTTDPNANAAAAGTANTANASEDGGVSWMLLVVGGLLVAAGIGAMVLVMMRRKNARNDDDADGGAGFGGGPTGSPVGPGRYGADATRVAAPVGAARGNDATMVAGAGMGAGGLSDAPTMIHRAPVEDEFPDPYGAPMPPQGGFVGGGAGNSQWDDNQGGYGGEYGGGQYGAQAGGYDNGQQRYDEHTSMYQPEQQSPQRYDEHTNLYQPNNGGYDDGYGGGYGEQGGWDNGNQAGTYGGGYDQAGNYGGQGGYDQGHGGYDQGQGGYDQGGYGAQGGYGQQGQPPQGQGGYGNQGGYEQRGGSYGQDPNRRGNRDWDE